MDIEPPQTFLLPGQSLEIQKSDLNLKISKDFLRNPYNNTISTKKPGVLIHIIKKNAEIFGLDTNTKKYFPEIGDFVIGTIKSKISEAYVVNIGGINDCSLGFYEFEGATKRNRPMLNSGDIIYSRIIDNNKYLMTKLTCFSSSNKKEWMTGEAFFGELKNGMILDFPINFCRALINDKNAEILNLIKKYVSFEICIGVNGRIWIKTAHAKNTIIVLNSLKFAQKLDLIEFESYLAKISTFLIQ